MSDADDLRETLDLLVAALNRLVAGDPQAFEALYSHEDDVTVFGGFGSYERGWDRVKQNTEFAASRFAGGHMGVEPLAMGTSGDLAYSVWIERGEAQVAGRGEVAPLALRVTHIFRRENGTWRIIHRHGDAIMEKIEATAVLQREGG